jgi:hypothetical protein
MASPAPAAHFAAPYPPTGRNLSPLSVVRSSDIYDVPGIDGITQNEDYSFVMNWIADIDNVDGLYLLTGGLQKMLQEFVTIQSQRNARTFLVLQCINKGYCRPLSLSIGSFRG